MATHNRTGHQKRLAARGERSRRSSGSGLAAGGWSLGVASAFGGENEVVAPGGELGATGTSLRRTELGLGTGLVGRWLIMNRCSAIPVPSAADEARR